MADDRVAHLDTLHTAAHLFDPAGVFMAHDVGQRDIDLAAPDAFHDVQIGAAHTGAANPDNDISGTLDLRIVDIFVAHEFFASQ
jgi:hypothetical protein